MPKIVRFHEVGGPENLRIEEMPVQLPGKDEVRLRVQAIGLNRAEALFMRGSYFEKPALPSRIGVECAGVIDAAVMQTFSRMSLSGTCGKEAAIRSGRTPFLSKSALSWRRSGIQAGSQGLVPAK